MSEEECMIVIMPIDKRAGVSVRKNARQMWSSVFVLFLSSPVIIRMTVYYSKSFMIERYISLY